MFAITKESLRIPESGKLTSYSITKCGGTEFWTTENTHVDQDLWISHLVPLPLGPTDHLLFLLLIDILCHVMSLIKFTCC